MLRRIERQWLQFPGGKSDQNARRRHKPDQIASRNDIRRKAGCKIAENESERAP
jgi:hypothetical protein